MTEQTERFSRQWDLVPLARLRDTTITVIGVGAIGRQVTLQLAALGAPQLQLIDFDRVDATNVVTQGYFAADIDELKVAATARTAHLIDSATAIEPIADRFRPSHQVGQVVFVCVDSIAARTAIWRALEHRVDLWLDGRMLGEVVRVLTASRSQDHEHYAASLFAPQEAQPGRCTARSTIYAASIAAGLMVHQFTRWLRDLPTDGDMLLNLLSSETTVS